MKSKTPIVTLMNPETVKNMAKTHGEFACVCYNTNPKYAQRVGEKCQEDGHWSGSRTEYIKFKITDVDRGTAEQCLRHEIGVDVPIGFQDNYSYVTIPQDEIVKNMASFRYIDKTDFDYATPAHIHLCNEAKDIYEKTLQTISSARNQIRDILIKTGINDAKATEESNFLLPRATCSEFMIGFTPEALIHFCHKRLCTRAQEFIKDIAKQMKDAVSKENPSFGKMLVPQCEYLTWCPEGNRCCGKRNVKQTEET